MIKNASLQAILEAVKLLKNLYLENGSSDPLIKTSPKKKLLE